MFYLTPGEKNNLAAICSGFDGAVPGELRGWNHADGPLRPAADLNLSLRDVANKYCDTLRDLYLSRKNKIKFSPNPLMLEGWMVQEVLHSVITRAKRIIYSKNPEEALNILEASGIRDGAFINKKRIKLSEEDYLRINGNLTVLWNREYALISARLQELLALKDDLSEDAIVMRSVPLMPDVRYGGLKLGLSDIIETDVLLSGTLTPLDIKFGTRRDFHRLFTAGSALVMECETGVPVNAGITLYIRFNGEGEPEIEKDIYPIDAGLRQAFIKERDERTEMLQKKAGPPVSSSCYNICPFFTVCNK